MKNIYIAATLILCSFGVQAAEADKSPITSVEIQEGVSVTINVKSEGQPVAGALIKIVHNRITVGSRTTDASGNATVSVKNYTGQVVSIEVFHKLYASEKLHDRTLKEGANFNVIMRSKKKSAEEIAAASEEKTEKIEGQIANEQKSAEEAAAEKEASLKRQEELRKEQEEIAAKTEKAKKEIEEAAAETEAIRKEAEELKNGGEEMTEERRAEMEKEIAAREAAAKQRQEEAEARRKELEEKAAATAALERDRKAEEAAKKEAERVHKVNLN